MRNITNPYVDSPGYNCFGCSPSNPLGLAMSFFEEGSRVLSHWEPKASYQGFSDVLHGGIQATLMDELASWYVMVKMKTSGMTEGMEIRYHKPVYTTGGTVTLSSELEESEKRRARIRVRLFQGSEGEPKSEGVCTYTIFPEKLARKKLHYPGYEAFFPEER